MGGEPWDCSVPFGASVEAALQAVLRQVFDAGRYRGSDRRPATIEAAIENAGGDGTASVLDMLGVSDESDFCAVGPLPADKLVALFGTTRPSRADVDECDHLFDDIERGQGIYVVVYDGDEPSEYHFAGYSFD